MDQDTGNITLQPGMTNVVILHNMVKAQESRHIKKVSDKNKCIKGMSNEIIRLLQGIVNTKVTNTCF